MASTIATKKAKSNKSVKSDSSQSAFVELSHGELDNLMEIWSALTAILQAQKSDYYKRHPGELQHLFSALGFIEKGLGGLINDLNLRSIAD